MSVTEFRNHQLGLSYPFHLHTFIDNWSSASSDLAYIACAPLGYFISASRTLTSKVF